MAKNKRLRTNKQNKRVIPKRIKVGNFDYEIKLVKELKYEDDDCNGLCDKHKSIIYLQEELSEDKMRETLLHELIHACEGSYGFRPLNDDKQVHPLGLALAEIFKRNPELKDAL